MANKVNVYVSNTIEEWKPGEFDRLMAVIPEVLRKKVLEEQGWEEQYGSLARKLMLWHGMRQMDANMNDLFESVQFTQSGKPYLTDAPNFSLANDGAVAICAISNDSVIGADIERLKPINLSDYREMMTFLEWREIYSNMVPLRRFYEFWTIKESVLKADGEIIKPDLKEIYIQPDVAFFNARNWYVNPIEVDIYGYVAFLVSSSPNAEIEIVDVNLPELF